MTIELDGASLQEGVLDGLTLLEVWVGDKRIWSATVQITLGTGNEAQVQLRAALSARGLNYSTVTEIPFDIELVGTGSVSQMFHSCAALTSVPDMDTSSVTDMSYMFRGCSSLTDVPAMDTSSVTNMTQMFYECAALPSVPDMDTSQVTNTRYMFYNCPALTDGNVRLIGRHPQVDTTGMISGSGLTREPFFDAAGNPIVPEEVYQVTLTDKAGQGTVHPLVSVTVPAGQVWDVQIQGTVTKSPNYAQYNPKFRIGSSTSGAYGTNASVDFSGTVSSTNATIAMVTNMLSYSPASFTGTVTIRK